MEHYLEYTFDTPKGMYYSDVYKIPDNFASNIVNFLPTNNGLEMRKGYKTILKQSNIFYICSFNEKHVLVLFTSKGISIFSGAEQKNITIDIEEVIEPIDHMETNGRLLIFIQDALPKELYYDNLTKKYKLVDLEFSPAEGEFLNNTFYTGAEKYRERLFYYAKGDSTLYYCEPLMYKGQIKELNLSYVFGLQGSLQTLGIMGYNSGATLESSLVAVFDTGDILVMEGTNPEDSDNWKFKTKLSINETIYDESIRLGNNLNFLSKSGLFDCNSLIVSNSIVKSRYISLPLYNSDFDFSNLKHCIFNNNVYFFNKSKLENKDDTILVLSLETMGYSLLKGIKVFGFTSLENKLYFYNEQGLFEAFSYYNDDGKDIEASYLTKWEDFGTTKKKKINNINLYLEQRSNHNQISITLNTDYANSNKLTSYLPTNVDTDICWHNIRKNWSIVKKILWKYSKKYHYGSFKFSKSGFGRAVSVGVAVSSKATEDTEGKPLIIGAIKLNYKKATK